MEVEREEGEECPVKQVEMTVPKTDDAGIPAVTFRMWVLGITCCVLLSFVNQFFWYRAQPLMISSISAQIAVVPIGHIMARALPSRPFFQGSRFQFSMNPGPFNMKEHVLITIFANSGAGTVYATHILTAVKILYKRSLTFIPAFLVMITTQLLGFGWAGVFRKHLVEPAEMWWPGNLVQVSLFRALHEEERRPWGGLTRIQFFLIVFLASFAYYVLPGYLFSTISYFSWVCWTSHSSVLVHQLGSGMRGLGLGAFALDWSTVSSYLGSPLASPWFATANVAVGFVLVTYFMTPISYFNNLYKAKTFPLFSNSLFTSNGSRYDISSIITPSFELDQPAYARTGPVHLSTFFAMTYGLGFATLSATIVHVFLFHGRDIWAKTRSSFLDTRRKEDVHTRLMRRYPKVPSWWFHVILVGNVAAILFACQYYNDVLQLPWWGVLLACAIAVFFTLPIGVITATTNQQPGLNIITEYVIGYLYPGRPVANMCFKVYGYISMSQALSFLADFKLGHYMKIPPRAMFMAQILGTVISVIVYQATAWRLMGSTPNLCEPEKLPEGSPWTCPMDVVFYDASVIWGLVGPRRIFGDLGAYAGVNWFFLGGAAAPVAVWAAHKAFPRQTWIKKVHMPVLLGATSMMPPATPVNFTSWIMGGFLSGFLMFRYRQGLWERYNYVLSGALDAGTAFMTVLLFVTLGSDHTLEWWGNRGEGCPLAVCPTASGVRGPPACPAF